MKYLFVLLIIVFAATVQNWAAPPLAVAQGFEAIHESILLAVHEPPIERMGEILKYDLLESPENARYWGALKSIATEAAKPGSQDWIAGLDKLDKEILKISQDYQLYPKRVQDIADWYGGYEADVPQRARLEFDNKVRVAQGLPALEPVSEEEYKSAVRRAYTQKVVPQVTRIKEMHVTAEYRLAWEAWLLAPFTTRHKAFLVNTGLLGLQSCATDASIPVVLAFARQVDEKTREPRDVPGLRSHMNGVWDILMRLTSDESLLAALQMINFASERNMNVARPSPCSQEAIDKLSSNRIAFIESVSGYYQKMVPGEDNLQHTKGRSYLPAINALLSRADVIEGDKLILKEARDRILRYAPETVK